MAYAHVQMKKPTRPSQAKGTCQHLFRTPFYLSVSDLDPALTELKVEAESHVSHNHRGFLTRDDGSHVRFYPDATRYRARGMWTPKRYFGG